MAEENKKTFWVIPKEVVDLEKILQMTGFVIGKQYHGRINPESRAIYWKRTGENRVVGSIYDSNGNERTSYAVCYPADNMDVLNGALRLKNLFDINNISYSEQNKDPIVGKLKTLTKALETSIDGGTK